MIQVHIGIDDVDSINGGCTTHYATQLAWILLNKGYMFGDYLNLVRLNPAVPWKTRGNGAVAIRLIIDTDSKIEDLYEILKITLEEYVRNLVDLKHQPSIALHVGEVPREYKWLASKALYDVVPLDLLFRLLDRHREKTRVYYLKGKRGLIGAIAAIGYTMENTDYTYELIAYRKRDYWGMPRKIDPVSIAEMDKRFGQRMILNYDHESNRPLIIPHGPDPVLLGLRGEDPFTLLEAFRTLRIDEPVEYLALYRTNQHTDSHIHKVNSILEINPYMCVSVTARVVTKPRRIQGGHIIFRVCDGTSCIDVAVYEPAKRLRDIAERLEPGDLIEVVGCTRPPSSTHGLTLNTEKIRIIELTDIYKEENPRCPVCGARMESMGKNKGFRCRKCGFRDRYITKMKIRVQRDIEPGIYQPPWSSFKHVMKPVERIGREKNRFTRVELFPFVFKLS